MIILGMAYHVCAIYNVSTNKGCRWEFLQTQVVCRWDLWRPPRRLQLDFYGGPEEG